MIKYVLLTPARNEETYIEKTIQAVLAQSILPQEWIIINDGSTDKTAEIAQKYADEYDFIELINIDGDEQRNFGSRTAALVFAYSQVKDSDFTYVGSLDADITFQPDYYENILQELETNPRLGIAGGIRYDFKDGRFVLIPSARNSVCGAIQLFRKDCYEAIDGYRILSYGGVDTVAGVAARMEGWEVRSYTEHLIWHHRPTGTANRSKLGLLYRAGVRDYTIGYHPLFELLRSFKYKPYILGALAMYLGYLSGFMRRIERPVSTDYMEFLHEEQLGRIKDFLRRTSTPD